MILKFHQAISVGLRLFFLQFSKLPAIGYNTIGTCEPPQNFMRGWYCFWNYKKLVVKCRKKPNYNWNSPFQLSRE